MGCADNFISQERCVACNEQTNLPNLLVSFSTQEDKNATTRHASRIIWWCRRWTNATSLLSSKKTKREQKVHIANGVAHADAEENFWSRRMSTILMNTSVTSTGLAQPRALFTVAQTTNIVMSHIASYAVTLFKAQKIQKSELHETVNDQSLVKREANSNKTATGMRCH